MIVRTDSTKMTKRTFLYWKEMKKKVKTLGMKKKWTKSDEKAGEIKEEVGEEVEVEVEKVDDV